MDGPGFVIGNIAKGKDLWDRQSEIDTISKSLEKSSVLLKAPRRFGKTSIMYRLYDNPRPSWTVFFQDTEGMRTPAEFISGIMAKALPQLKIRRALQSARGWISNALQQVDEFGLADFRVKIRESIEHDWQEKGLELISTLQAFEDRILFILDEHPARLVA